MPTPTEPEGPHPGPVLEPVRVLRPRRFDALAELMREMETLQASATPTDEADTQEMPSVPPTRPARPSVPPTRPARPAGRRTAPPAGRRPALQAGGHTAPQAGGGHTAPQAGGRTALRAGGRTAHGPRRAAAVAAAVAVAALLGFGGALLLPGRQDATATPPAPRPATTAPPATAPAPAPTASRAPAAGTDPDGPGTLREGDTGPEVTDLQERLLRVPDVYRDGSTSGTYDANLRAAVARFQLWYGISGDERGVYGDDTRRALESRTGPGDGS